MVSGTEHTHAYGVGRCDCSVSTPCHDDGEYTDACATIVGGTEHTDTEHIETEHIGREHIERRFIGTCHTAREHTESECFNKEYIGGEFIRRGDIY